MRIVNALVSLAGCSFLAFTGCASEATSESTSKAAPMTLTISSDYASPAEADSFRVMLAQSNGVLFDNTYPLGPAGMKLPASLALCPDGGDCKSGTIAPGTVAIISGDPVLVNVDLFLGELKLGSQSATVTNTNEAKTVALTFSKACAAVVCESGKRCSPTGECVYLDD